MANVMKVQIGSHFICISSEIKKFSCYVDYNKIQSLDTISKTLELEPFADKWKSFGWHVVEIDGHNHNEL